MNRQEAEEQSIHVNLIGSRNYIVTMTGPWSGKERGGISFFNDAAHNDGPSVNYLFEYAKRMGIETDHAN